MVLTKTETITICEKLETALEDISMLYRVAKDGRWPRTAKPLAEDMALALGDAERAVTETLAMVRDHV